MSPSRVKVKKVTREDVEKALFFWFLRQRNIIYLFNSIIYIFNSLNLFKEIWI